jgi:hypothetical protein
MGRTKSVPVQIVPAQEPPVVIRDDIDIDDGADVDLTTPAATSMGYTFDGVMAVFMLKIQDTVDAFKTRFNEGAADGTITDDDLDPLFTRVTGILEEMFVDLETLADPVTLIDDEAMEEDSDEDETTDEEGEENTDDDADNSEEEEEEGNEEEDENTDDDLDE